MSVTTEVKWTKIKIPCRKLITNTTSYIIPSHIARRGHKMTSPMKKLKNSTNKTGRKTYNKKTPYNKQWNRQFSKVKINRTCYEPNKHKQQRNDNSLVFYTIRQIYIIISIQILYLGPAWEPFKEAFLVWNKQYTSFIIY